MRKLSHPLPVFALPPERTVIERLAARVNGYILIGLITLIGMIALAGLIDALEREDRRIEMAERV